MQVKEIMQTPVLSVKRGTTLSQLLELFKDFHSFPVVPVVDNDNILIGIVHIKSFFEIFQPHHQDILMRNPLSMISREPTNIFDIDIEEGMGFLVLVADIMDKKIVKIKETQDLKEAYNLMQLHGRNMVPVVDDQKKLVGIISVFDIVMRLFKEKGLL
ncbi:MAG: CBS domain-containing protein [Candidatus Omnitrophota bacterium]